MDDDRSQLGRHRCPARHPLPREIPPAYSCLKTLSTLTYTKGLALPAVAPGEFVCVRGPSGSGKSTLLSLLAGLTNPTRGTITVLGCRYGEHSSSELAAFRGQHLGYLSPDLPLIDHLTALENVELPCMFAEEDQASLRARAYALLTRVGLAARANHVPSTLSVGERQRTCLARALITHPDCLLADEPTANLDTKNVEVVLEIFHRLRAEGVSILVATHDERVATAADRSLHMLDGCLA